MVCLNKELHKKEFLVHGYEGIAQSFIKIWDEIAERMDRVLNQLYSKHFEDQTRTPDQ